MARFSIEAPHRLDAARCREVLDSLLRTALQQHAGRLGHCEQRWSDDRLTFSVSAAGMTVSGDLVIQAARVVVTGECPWLVRGRLEETLRQQLQRSLAR